MECRLWTVNVLEEKCLGAQVKTHTKHSRSTQISSMVVILNVWNNMRIPVHIHVDDHVTMSCLLCVRIIIIT